LSGVPHRTTLSHGTEMMAMRTFRNDEPRHEAGRHQKLSIWYGLFSFLSNVTGSVFWWAEQKRWKLADQIEQQEAAR
jgi:hypothetical protein